MSKDSKNWQKFTKGKKKTLRLGAWSEIRWDSKTTTASLASPPLDPTEIETKTRLARQTKTTTTWERIGAKVTKESGLLTIKTVRCSTVTSSPICTGTSMETTIETQGQHISVDYRLVPHKTGHAQDRSPRGGWDPEMSRQRTLKIFPLEDKFTKQNLKSMLLTKKTRRNLIKN